LTTQFKQDLYSYTPVSFGGSYLFQKYEAVQGFLRHNFSSDFHSLLLKPVKNGNQIEFLSEGSLRLKELSGLSSEEKSNVLEKYNALLFEIEVFRQKLSQRQGEDAFYWNTLLEKIFDPTGHLILSDGNQVMLVWGLVLNLQNNHLLPISAFAHLLTKDEETPNGTDGIKEESKEIVQNETEENLINPQEQESIENAESFTDNPSIASEYPPEQISLPEKHINKSLNETEELKNQGSVSKKRKRFSTPFTNGITRFLDSCENLGRRHPWLVILFLLALLIFAYFLFQEPNWYSSTPLTEAEIQEKYAQIMPETPRTRKRPVRREDRIKDEETRSEIVGNVVNIALKKKNDDFRQFALKLKQAFPDSSYEIVYFDDETQRLQFAFPMEKRLGIKEEIKKKVNAFEMLIWDEAIFSTFKTFNDPSFRDPEKAGPWNAVGLPAAWDISIGDTSVIVAIIDDGFDLNHEEFRGRIVNPYNVVSRNNQVFSNRNRFHGTHVGGIIGAAGNNRMGMSGVAPGCLLMPIQAAAEEGQFLMTDVVDGILYAIKNNADVINLSLGMAFGEEIKQLSLAQQQELAAHIGVDAAQFWEELFEMAERNNVIIVAAAGNQDIMVGLDPIQRSEKVIKVAAADNIGSKAEFSNFFLRIPPSGCCVSAPGVRIYSTMPDGNYDFLDGTSMAAPIVSGIIALLKSSKPELTNQQIMKIISETGRPTANPFQGPFIQASTALARARF
jgi:hypothetical protein